MTTLSIPRAAALSFSGLLMCVILAAGASAQNATRQAGYQDWTVYTADSSAGRMCFAQSRAEDKMPLREEHGEVTLSVVSWSSGAARRQVQMATGSDLKIAAPARARVGGRSFKLFTEGQDAFVDQLDEEERLVTAMKRGADVMISVLREDGTELSYAFSLSGITRAIERVDALCGG